MNAIPDKFAQWDAAYVLGVDLEANRIDVDWEADY